MAAPAYAGDYIAKIEVMHRRRTQFSLMNPEVIRPTPEKAVSPRVLRVGSTAKRIERALQASLRASRGFV